MTKKYESRLDELEKQNSKLTLMLGTFIGLSARELGHERVKWMLEELDFKYDDKAQKWELTGE